MSNLSLKSKIYLSALFSISIFIGGCAVEAAKNETIEQTDNSEIYSVTAGQEISGTKGKITITENSPADTIRTFYKNLREKRFREAIFLTNLRPAIEGLTDQELTDLQVDFTNLAQIIPDEIQISGEIITNDKATVMAKLPDNETGKVELKEFKLAKQNGGWLILMIDRRRKRYRKTGQKLFLRAENRRSPRGSRKNVGKGLQSADGLQCAKRRGIYRFRRIAKTKSFAR